MLNILKLHRYNVIYIHVKPPSRLTFFFFRWLTKRSQSWQWKDATNCGAELIVKESKMKLQPVRRRLHIDYQGGTWGGPQNSPVIEHGEHVKPPSRLTFFFFRWLTKRSQSWQWKDATNCGAELIVKESKMKLQPVRRRLHIDYHLKVGTRLGLKSWDAYPSTCQKGPVRKEVKHYQSAAGTRDMHAG